MHARFVAFPVAEPPTNPPPTVDLLGMRIHPVTFTRTLDLLVNLAGGQRPAYAVTVNVDHLVRYANTEQVRPLYEQADLVVADGMPLVWASRLLGARLPERVAGSDIFPALCARAAENNLSVFLLGGAPGSALSAADVLRKQNPALRIAGTYCPPFGFENDPAECVRIVDAIRAVRPNILFVGLGSPKQERWIVNNRTACNVPLSIGVGISFSFISGHVKRAPKWMQRVGLEWLHRLCQEPRRLWKRYLLRDSMFLYLVAKAFVRRIFKGRSLSTERRGHKPDAPN